MRGVQKLMKNHFISEMSHFPRSRALSICVSAASARIPVLRNPPGSVPFQGVETLLVLLDDAAVV